MIAIAVICLTVPSLIVINEVRKNIHVNRYFNFNKELKRVRHKMPRQNIDINNSTLIGHNGRKPVYIPDDGKHYFVCGTTGSGKTVALSNLIKSAVEKNYPLLLVDGKGDTSQGSMLDIVSRFHQGTNRKLYIVNLTDPMQSCRYNPFKNASPTIAKDMLINMTNWSEEHYKLNSERYLQRLVMLLHMAKVPLSLKQIVKYMDTGNFADLSATLLESETISTEEHFENVEIAKTSGKIASGSIARFSTIAESELGHIFSDDGIDISTALQENATILFVLNPLIYPELSPLLGRLILIDSKKAISNLYQNSYKREFFIFDEINVYASKVLIDIVNKSRSANVTCILAAQSLSDLSTAEDEHFTEQVIENCNNYLVLRQNSAVNAEQWANILGTRQSMEVTYQLQQKGLNTAETGFGSARRVREFLYHPDDIKALRAGKGIFLSRDLNFNSKVNILKPF